MTSLFSIWVSWHSCHNCISQCLWSIRPETKIYCAYIRCYPVNTWSRNFYWLCTQSICTEIWVPVSTCGWSLVAYPFDLLRCGFFRSSSETKQIFSHCLSFFDAEIPSLRKQRRGYLTKPIPWRLMSWRRKEAGHQRPWHWSTWNILVSAREKLTDQVTLLLLLLLLTSITAWISNDIPSKMWDEITYPFPNFNG